jgi:5-methylcytosine-specific restriction endonuclease McrA
MTTPLLHRLSVLVLNRHWLAIDAATPADAFHHLASGSARALRIEEDVMEPLGWDDWLALDAGPRSVGTPKGRVRIPSVIVLARFERVPMHLPGFGFEGLWTRDGGRCQYTGRRLQRHEANIDHVVPRSRGGADNWENCVLSDKRVNHRKGARTPEEAGLKLLNRPSAPQPVPKLARLRNLWNVPEWRRFIDLPVEATSGREGSSRKGSTHRC